MFISSKVLEYPTGDAYNDGAWHKAEQQFWTMKNMNTKYYISTECSLFGCTDGYNDEMIDYSDKIFCKYSVKGDLGWC